MVIIDMQEEHVLVTVGGHSDTIKLREGNSPFDFVLVLHFYELFDEDLQNVGVFENIEDSLVSDEEDSLFAFPVAIIF